jgi:hypothetical protein
MELCAYADRANARVARAVKCRDPIEAIASGGEELMLRQHCFTLFACLSGLAACTVETSDIGSLNEPLGLIECRSDDACPNRGDVCLVSYDERGHVTGGYCGDGNRCHSSEDCARGLVCRGGDGVHCLYVEADPVRPADPEPVRPGEPARPEPEPTACPRGTFPPETPILCAPGFVHTIVTRDGCATCEPGRPIADRCLAAGIPLERCRELLGVGDEPSRIAERCRLAGLTPERCRALAADDPADPTRDIGPRCRAAEIPWERCRYLASGDDEPTTTERCRLAGLTLERCRYLASGDDGTSTTRDPATRDPEPTR